jgi:hypothetical protein
VGAEVLDRKALNRATLGRQLVLRRSAMPVLAAVEHLVGRRVLDQELARHRDLGAVLAGVDLGPVLVRFLAAGADPCDVRFVPVD